MCIRIVCITCIFTLCTSTSIHAFPRHTLISPNMEVSGDFGRSVSGCGDANNDGYDDILVGAKDEDSQPGMSGSGRVYLFSGRTGSLLYQLVSPHEEPGGHFGYSVAFIGDVNNNGCDDFAVGANWEESDIAPASSGRAYVFEGLTGILIHTLITTLPTEHGNFGISIAAAGDVNNDTYGDIIVGAYQEQTESGPENAGRAHVFSGLTGTIIHSLISPNEQYNGRFGWAVSSVGDANGDNHSDLLVGAYSETAGPGPSNTGAAYVFSGATGDTLYAVLSPIPETTGYFGWAVSGAADCTDDGARDILVGALFEEPDGSPYAAGRAHLFDGTDGSFIRTFVSPNEMASGGFGYAVAGIGDVDIDNKDDILIGAHREHTGIAPVETGMAYIYSGASGALLESISPPNPEAGGWFGGALSGMGDINGDGMADIAATAEEESPGGILNAGRAYIYSPGVVVLNCHQEGQNLALEWTPWTLAPDVDAYWIYGADNLSFFQPEIIPPYTYRQAAIPAGTQSWLSPQGIGDPDHNWTYLVIVVDQFQQVIYQSNRVGERDFGIEIP